MPAKPSGSAATTRLRKLACGDCGYTVRVARSWMLKGLPSCCCGGRLEPTDPVDMATIGLIGPDSMSQAEWNAICRAAGWEILRNEGQQRQHDRRKLLNGGDDGPSGPVREHCRYAGCGRFVGAHADHCAAGHAQHAGACDRGMVVEMPF